MLRENMSVLQTNSNDKMFYERILKFDFKFSFHTESNGVMGAELTAT